MKRGLIYGSIAIALLSILWWKLHKHNVKQDAAITSPALKPGDEAKIIINPHTHTIISITPKGSHATYLPRNGASVEISKTGEVKTNARVWGTEVAPFIGTTLGTDVSFMGSGGINFFYVYRWELGGGLLVGEKRDTKSIDARVFMHVSYNVYDNWYLAVGADNKGAARLEAGLKF